MSREPIMRQEMKALLAHIKELENQLLLLRNAICESLRARIKELENKLLLLRNAICGTCGRSLPPDGDCYGCQVDRLEGQLATMQRALKQVKTIATWVRRVSHPFANDLDKTVDEALNMLKEQIKK